jgi:hypothetical protein
MVDSTCDTHHLMVDTKEAQEIDDDSLNSREMESYNGPMKKSLVEEESEEVAHNESNGNNKCENEDTKEEHQELQNDLSKMIVRPWEELSFNKDRHGLGYDKGNNFHIPNYSKPIQSVSARFLEEVTNLDNKCQHCHRVGHLETQCFDLHPCLHCGKTNHLSEKCQKKKKIKKTINYGWITSWKWNLQVNKLHKSYHLVKTEVKTQLRGEMTTTKRFQTTIPDDFSDDPSLVLYVL